MFFLFLVFYSAFATIYILNGVDYSWSYDSNTRHLTFWGNGNMPDFTEETPPSWSSFRGRIQKITIKNFTSIGNYSFHKCNALEEVIIPSSVESIGKHAFSFCLMLPRISLPNNVTSIGESAFFYCQKLQSISIPESVISIEEYAFISCTSLTTIEIPITNKINFIGHTAFLQNDLFTTLVITGNGTMKDYSDLNDEMAPWTELKYQIKKVIIQNEITSIGNYSFYQMSNLETIILPESVNSIGSGAFSSCPKLQSITIPANVTSIEDYTFSNCLELKIVEIPNGLTSIGNYAFYSCKSLESIGLSGNVKKLGNYTFYGALNLKTIPNKIQHFGSHTFENSGIESIMIGNGIDSNEGVYIDEFAFSNCFNLKSVEIKPRFLNGSNDGSNKSCSIQRLAFYNCSSIESFIIGGYVDEVKEYAFDFNGTIPVYFEYNSTSSPQNCSSYDNDSFVLPIFSENVNLINVSKYYESRVFCPCDKLGCPKSYIEENDYEKIENVSVPVSNPFVPQVDSSSDEESSIYSSENIVESSSSFNTDSSESNEKSENSSQESSSSSQSDNGVIINTIIVTIVLILMIN